MIKKVGDKAADLIAEFVGSWLCIGLHIVWFSLWFILRADINLLTLIVSLEAIFLCTILLMSQNRQSAKDREKAEIDLEIDTKAERLIEGMLQQIIDMELHLDKQDHLIVRILRQLQADIESELPTREIPVIEERPVSEIPDWASHTTR